MPVAGNAVLAPSASTSVPTSSVVTLANGQNAADLVSLAAPGGAYERVPFGPVLLEGRRNARRARARDRALGHGRVLEGPKGSRVLQSFKSVAANPTFEHASLLEKRLRFEKFGRIFLHHLFAHAGEELTSIAHSLALIV